MKQLTNKQLSDLREKWIFYCNHSAEEVYKCGFKIPPVIKEIQEENELVLRLIENAIKAKSAPKKKKRSNYHKQYYKLNKEKLNKANTEYQRKIRADAKEFRKLQEENNGNSR